MKTKIAFILYLLFTSTAWSSGFLMQENKGQFDDKVLFKLPLNYGAVFVEKNKLTFVLHHKEQLDKLKNEIHHHDQENSDHNHQRSASVNTDNKEKHFNSHSFSITFEGANDNSVASGQNSPAHYYNYFQGNDPTKWASHVQAYKDLWIKNLYDGIDFHMYGVESNIKYDFIIAPNTSPDKIKLFYQGVDKLKLHNNKIEIITSVGTLTDEKPYSFNSNQRSTNPVGTFYKLNHHTVSYQISNYNTEDTLVLDPVLNFATFSGSTIDNWGFTATYDNDDNAFGGGVSFGTGYPVTVGAFQSNFGGGPSGPYSAYPTDMTISKFSADGSNLIYATYLGGSKLENPHSLVVSPNNELIIFGTTSSRDFPTSANAFDKTFNGGATVVVDNVLYFEGSDIVVTKLSADGSTLIGSTYYGGSANDGFNDETHSTGLYHNYSDVFRGEVISDASGNAYIATTTSSTDLPIVNGFQSSYGGGTHDGCVVKLNSDFSQVLWSTYLGGIASDGVYALQSNSGGELYVTGGTNSADFPIVGSTNQTTISGGIDGFIAQINNTGSSLLNSSFIGSVAYDQGYFVQVDEEDKVYVMGQTLGNLPISGGTYNNPNSGLFVHKYSSNLSVLEASTIVGNGSGSTDIVPSAFLVDNCEKVYISGWSGLVNGSYSGGTSFGLPITSDAFQSGTDGSDFYLMVLEKDFTGLNYSTFFGSSGAYEHVDGGTSRFSKNGTVYQAVCAACGSDQSSFPVTAGAYSTALNSPNCNMAVFKFDASKLTARINPISDTLVCQNDTIHFYNQSNGGVTIEWQFHDGTTSADEHPWKIFDTPGEYEVKLIVTDPTICPGSDTTTMNFTVKQIIVPTINSADSVICEGNTTTVIMNETSNYIWYEKFGEVNSFQTSFTFSPIVNTTLYITRTELCSDTLAIPVEVIKFPIADTMTTILCPGDTTSFPIPLQSDFSYSWQPMNDATMKDDRMYFYPGDSTKYELTITGTCGTAVVTYEVNVVKILPVISPDTTICAGDTITLTATGGDNYLWTPETELLNGNTSSSVTYEGDTSITFDLLIEKQGCFTQEKVFISVLNQEPSPSTYNVLLCAGDTTTIAYSENGLFNYSWDHQNNLTIANDSLYIYPSENTVYEVTIDGYCGTAIVLYEVDVIDISTTLSPDTTICIGDTITLTASGGDTYLWTPGFELINGNTGPSVTYNGTTSTLFEVLAQMQGCAVLDSVQVIVVSQKPSAATYLEPLCAGDTVTLPYSENSLFNYTWDHQNELTITNDSLYFYPSDSTSHELSVTGLCGSAMVNYNIGVTTITPSIILDSTICFGDSINLTTSGGDSYEWSPAINSTVTTGSSPLYIGEDTTTFAVIISKNQCTAIEQVTITVKPEGPQPEAHSESLCEGQKIGFALQSQSDYTYSWNSTTGLIFSNDSVIMDPSLSSAYELTITGLCGIELVPYNIHRTIITSDASRDTIVCLNETVPLFAKGGTSVIWSPSVNGNSSDYLQTFTGDTTTTFKITISENQCSEQQEVTVKVLPARPVNNSHTANVCEGDIAKLPLSTQDDFIYSWSPRDKVSTVGDSALFDVSSSSSFTLTITGECGNAVVDYDITVNTIYDSIATPPLTCQEDTVILKAFGGDEYLWSPATDLSNPNIWNPTLTVDKSMSYFVTIIKNGCVKSREVKVNAIALNRQSFDREHTINYGERQELNLSNKYRYEFTPSTYLNCQSCANKYSEAEEDIVYHFDYWNETGCPVNDSIKINVIYELYIPNAFSPNGDGSNDFFNAYSHKIKTFQMDIFNRWGQIIFSSDDISKGWNGYYAGHAAQIDVYVWKISYVKAHSNLINERVGTVTLVR